MIKFRTLALATLAAPLALGLSACNSADEAGVTESEAIDPIEAPAGQSWVDTTTVSEYDGYVLGNPEAPIKVVEYASLTCPACAAFAMNGAEQLKNEYVSTGRVSYEIRNQIHGPHDLALATMVRCGEKEAFHPLADQVWANLPEVLGGLQQNGGAVQDAVGLPPEQRLVRTAELLGFFDFFKARGLSEDQARQCLADETVYAAIAERSTSQSREFGVEGTPTFFINGSKVDANAWDAIEPLLQKAGAR
uniref:thioredoxin domain-containing protein n=1 Tax=Parerythrobacter lutipelagi TaxID=1964208 RepID=UPI0010F62364|nr:thioredoxin domain-containing protein [Parerythrobacter lutipelagi]